MNTTIESHKGLIKRLLSQLGCAKDAPFAYVLDINDVLKICNAFHSELSQGEPVAWTDEYFTRVINNTFKATGIFDELNKPLYEAPPSTEALQKELDKLTEDKAELIEYTRKLREALKNINFGVSDNLEMYTEEVLAIPQPKCMQQK